MTNTSGNAGKVSINGDFRVDSGALSGGIIKLEENPQGGSNFVALQAPSTLSSDLTFTLPATDGSAGQFLKTVPVTCHLLRQVVAEVVMVTTIWASLVACLHGQALTVVNG